MTRFIPLFLVFGWAMMEGCSSCSVDDRLPPLDAPPGQLNPEQEATRQQMLRYLDDLDRRSSATPLMEVP